jgi:rhodanese-related sulfurtransferase
MDGEISPTELATLLESGSDDAELRIVDIRSERAFDRGHLPESESIPFPQLTTRVDELTGADRIVTVCPHGISSRQAAQLVASYQGTTDARVESLHGGIEAWEQQGHELVASPAPDAPAEGPDAPF